MVESVRLQKLGKKICIAEHDMEDIITNCLMRMITWTIVVGGVWSRMIQQCM
jgi:hypothetical protein